MHWIMQRIPVSFVEVIREWPTYPALAKQLGMNKHTVQSWAARNAIPPAKFGEVVEAAKAWGYDQITLPLLARLHRERWAAHEGYTASDFQ